MPNHTLAGAETDVAAGMENIIGDYRAFFGDLLQNLEKAGIDVTDRPISHLGYRTAGFSEYRRVREQIRHFCIADVENVWNGRPIDKLLLRQPLSLRKNTEVSLIELIPPPHRGEYPMGLEHCGIVIGETFDEFIGENEGAFTGSQDQGAYCQPVYITFENNRAVKFYKYPLKDVVEKEGRRFLPYPPGIGRRRR
jgi:predicted metalloenzyme YecM